MDQVKLPVTLPLFHYKHLTETATVTLRIWSIRSRRQPICTKRPLGQTHNWRVPYQREAKLELTWDLATRRPLLWWQALQFGGRRKANIPTTHSEKVKKAGTSDGFDLKWCPGPEKSSEVTDGISYDVFCWNLQYTRQNRVHHKRIYQQTRWTKTTVAYTSMLQRLHFDFSMLQVAAVP